MAEQSNKKKIKTESVEEKQKKAGTSVKSLQADTKKYRKEIRDEAVIMEEKIKNFKKDVQEQAKENKEAASHMANSVNYFIGEINKKRKEFRAYVPQVKDYIKAFWG